MSDSFNPYKSINRQSMVEQQRKEMYQRSHAPKIIINDDPVIPNYPIQSSLTKNSQYNMKIVVVGDGGCGKTCLLVSYSQGKFPEIYVPTVFENYVTNVCAPNSKIIELALWDTAGQEEYDRLRPLSYPDADLLLICFSLDNLTSLQNVKDNWFPEVNHFCPGVPILLVGTKADLPCDFDPDLPIQLAMEINAVGYIQCSAKQMFNIKTVFNFALNHFQKQQEVLEQEEKSNSARKRLSKVLGNGSTSSSHSRGHSKSHSRNLSGSQRRGHLKNTSYDSTILLDEPLTEDTYTSNPYGTFQPESKYNEDEFAFTRVKKKKKRRCVIL